MRSRLVPLSLVCLASCAEVPRVAVELPRRPAPAPMADPAPSGPAKPSDPTLAMLAEAEPIDSQFLPDGRLIAISGTHAYVADPRSSSPWGGLRRVPFEGTMRVSTDRSHYFRVGRSVLAEVDTTTLADRRTFTVEGTLVYAIPNRDGSRVVASHVASMYARPKLTVLDTKTFQPLYSLDAPSLGSGYFSDNGRYLMLSPTVMLDAATGKELRRSEEPFDVVGDYVVTSRGATLSLEHIVTHQKHTLALPCAGKVAFWHGHAAVACGSKLGVVRVAPGQRARAVDAKAPITYVDVDVTGDGFRLTLGYEQRVYSTATGALVAPRDGCVGEDWKGNVVGRGERFCQTAISPDGQWLTLRGINLSRASDGKPVFVMSWPRGPSDTFVAVQGNQLVVTPRHGGEPFYVPFDGTRPPPTYLARRTAVNLEVISFATKQKVAALPLEMSNAQIAGSGDEVVVSGSPSIGPPVVRCSLSKGTCQPIEEGGCTAVAIGEGRTLCAPTSGQRGTITQLVPGAPPRTLTLSLGPSTVLAHASKTGWVLQTRDPLPLMAYRAMVIPAAGFGSTVPPWKTMPGAILGVSGTLVVTERTPSALDVVDLVTNETTRIVVAGRGAVKIGASGRVAFSGDREDAEAQLLCLQGDRVLPWSECRDRESRW